MNSFTLIKKYQEQRLPEEIRHRAILSILRSRKKKISPTILPAEKELYWVVNYSRNNKDKIGVQTTERDQSTRIFFQFIK